VQCRRAELSIRGRRARRFEFQKRSQLVIGVSNETPSIVAGARQQSRLPHLCGCGRRPRPFKSNETAFRLPVQILVLRVFDSPRIWLTIPELFVATRRRYVLRVFPSYASGVSQWF
jgi:hypothetical protein